MINSRVINYANFSKGVCRMSIDEMIRLLREIDEEEREEAYTAIFPPYADECIERAEDCKQLAEWLEELKDYRRFNGAKTFDNGFNHPTLFTGGSNLLITISFTVFILFLSYCYWYC